MAWTVSDRSIDVQIEKILTIIRNEFGIKNCSKADVLRYLLSMHKQGKKTSPKWKRLFEEDTKL